PSRTWDYGLWRFPIARRPCPQGVATVCMGFGSCTVLIFSCLPWPILAGQAFFFF
ncbi:hypothetical protein M378DRAFT_58415, partial [Amanita muscaria Koide BX008]